MLLKYGVNPIFAKEVTDIFHILDDVFIRFAGREAIITSGNDGKHGKNSIHYGKKKIAHEVLRKQSGAFDLRTRDIPKDKVKSIVQYLKVKLTGFDIVNEASHIHCEWDPK